MLFFYYAVPILVGSMTGSFILTALSLPLTIFVSFFFMPVDKIEIETKKETLETFLLMVPKTRVVGSEEYNRKYMGL